ncbi:glycosyltransferase [Microbacterium sp. No. 7]|uniref:glycosyltransferase n=1 Tax=Microbacterium sp. No. 7 TaxID=1714373 RepID=UPI0006CFB840|nr:glycosyltransferase [Microbacterium sp. No. 7]ALJ19406.1 glycosyl transferase [Microbacterium sp. No. 7]
MPARVHALVVVRPDGRVPADLHLGRTLAALAAQTRPVDRLTVVVCGGDAEVREIAATADEVVEAPRRTGFARALASVTVEGDAVWLLAQDTAPAPDALERLVTGLDATPAIAVAAPKLVRWEDDRRIVSLGQTMTRGGRTVVRGTDEHDQGQWDGDIDVLGADPRGMLVRADDWRALGGIDPALGGADEGLDLGVRARLAGRRVVLAPDAVVAVAGDGVAGLPHERAEGRAFARAVAMRTARLHRRLVYAPLWAVPLHWLSLLLLAVVRTAGHLLAKQPSRIVPEWVASVTVLLGVAPVARARRRIARTRAAGWGRLAPLRATGRELRRRLDDGGAPEMRVDLHFFGGGGAWVVLVLLVVSIAGFLSLPTWSVLGGGALAPLRETVAGLWSDATFGPRPLGWATSGPADPFSGLVALLGSLWPAAPSRVLVVLWLLAIPLAGLGGWFAATRVTDRAALRALGAVVWAFAPMLLTALVEGRPTGVLVHLLLPWLLYAGAVAHRSWSGAGMASVLLVGVVAASPSLGPALGVLWLGALVLTIALRRGALARVVWLVVPTLVVFAPLVWRRLRAGEPWALLADPGVPVAGDHALGLTRRVLLAAGFPTSDAAGWARVLDGALVPWVALIVAPLLLLAAAAPLARRTLPAAVLLVTAGLGLATALAVVGVAPATTGTAPAVLWTGAALSVMWAGLCGAALVALDTFALARVARLGAAVLVGAVLAVAALPALTAGARGELIVTNGPPSTLPAYVAVEGRADASQATLVLTPRASGVIADVVWGGSATLGGQTTLRSASSQPSAGDEEVARLVTELVATSTGGTVAELAAHGIAFVVLSPVAGDAAAQELAVAAATMMDQRDDLEGVGDTGKGLLWRVVPEVGERRAAPDERGTAAQIATFQLGALAVALLLAAPTPSSRAFARRKPRVVGGESA